MRELNRKKEEKEMTETLCGGNTGLVSAKLYIFTGAEGGNGSIDCYFSVSGSRKFFCKEECKAEDILIKTDDIRAQSGRYSIEYRNKSSGGILSVTITHLTKSDAGRYRCGLGKALVPDSYRDLGFRVSDASLLDRNSGFVRTDTEGENITFPCSNTEYGRRKFFCKDECKKQEDILIETDDNRAQSGRYSIEYKEGSMVGLSVTITQVTKSDTGWYRCGYGRALSPDSYSRLQVLVIDAPNWTLRPFSTSVPSASTPTTQSLSSSSGSFTPSLAFPEATDQPEAAAPTTSKPNWTLRPFSTSVPSASTPTTTQSLSSSSGSSTPSSAFPKTTHQLTAASHVPHPGYLLPLVVCVSLVGVLLLVVFLLLLYKWKTRRNFTLNSSNMEFPVICKNWAPASTCEDSTYKTSRH